MKRFLIAIIALMLAFGCIGLPGTGGKSIVPNVSVPLPNLTGTTNQTTVTPPSSCSPSYSLSGPSETTLSESGTISGTASCADGKVLMVYVNGALATQQTVSGSTASVSISVPATIDGTNTVSVKVDGSEIYSAEWTVSPIGYFNTGGVDNDQISIKDWKAVAFEVKNPISVKKVGAYMRQLTLSTMQGTQIVAEIRSDSGGSPGTGYVAQSAISISKATLTPNWVYFPMDTTLSAGKYWLVFRVNQPSSPVVSDSVFITYYAPDKSKAGGADAMKMTLTRDEGSSTWDETTWQALAYERYYAYSISASD